MSQDITDWQNSQNSATDMFEISSKLVPVLVDISNYRIRTQLSDVSVISRTSKANFRKLFSVSSAAYDVTSHSGKMVHNYDQ